MLAALLLTIVGYVFDYKDSPKRFSKDARAGLFIFGLHIVLFFVARYALGISLLWLIQGIGLEILFVFALKAYIQSSKQPPQK